jgi:hypothetical protein
MRTRRIALVCAVVALLVSASTVGFACDGDRDGVCTCGAAGSGKPCSGDQAVQAAKLAAAAEGGCQASLSKLIALAKESGDDEAVALATKAEGGCAKSRSALIAMYKAEGEQASPHQGASMAQLAKWAEGGCEKSTAELIAKAKDSGDPKTAELAVRAEGGCEHSKAELIALAKESAEPAGADEN